MFGYGKVAKAKIDKSTAQILELEAQKKSLELDKDNLALELTNLKRKVEMEMELERHRQKLALEGERAVFTREKAVYEVDKKEMEDRLKREMELSKTEAITLMKLESQQKIKQTEIDTQRTINELKALHTEELAKVRTSSAEEYYKRLTAAFQDLQVNGDKNSRFIQDLALKMFDKVPSPSVGVDVTMSNVPKLVAPASNE